MPQGRYGGHLVIPTLGDPKTFNAILAEEQSSTEILGFLFEGLTTTDPVTKETHPHLAESWDIGPDQQTFVFHLRRDVLWNDGQPFTADDVVFTFNDLIYNPAVPNRLALFYAVDGKPFRVEKVDSHTVKFTTPGVYAPFLQFIAQPILPRHKLEAPVKSGEFMRTWGINVAPAGLVGTGAFRLRSYRPGQRTVLERNPLYWRAGPDGRRLPYLDHVIIEIRRDVNAMFLAFMSGKTDLSDADGNVIRPEDVALAKRLAPVRDYQVVERGPSSSTGFFWFNQNPGTNAATGGFHVAPHKRAWFSDVRFRQACSHAVDRQGIIDSVYLGMGRPLYSCETPANIRWFNPDVRQYPRDLAKARALLAEAGFTWRADGTLQDAKGNPVEFDLITNQGNTIRADLANVLRNNLAEIGIRMRPQLIDFNLLVAKLSDTFDYEAALLGLGGGAEDPSSALAVLLSSGRMHQWHPSQAAPATAWEARIDELMNAQLKTLDYATRKAYYDEVQAIMAEQQPFIYLVSPLAHGGIRNRVGNTRFPPTSFGSLIWNAEELYISER